ncbi:MAG: NADH-quinone oxidoreductase subunit L [bacterium]|nr:NADH-quinone oxidoreductase subunit L [bacterium]
MNPQLILLIPVLPLLAFLANGLFGRWLGRAGGWLAVLCMGGSAVIGAVLFIGALGGRIALPVDVTLWQWLAVGDLSVRVGFHVDQLTCLMLFFVTLVSSLVFLYSMGYMEGDPGFNRFFAYMGLFDFSMLVLVLGDSLPVMFVGWEGVGLCSYLLIGYYLALPGAADAGKKAFIVNRIGDFGFLVAMCMLFKATGTLHIQTILGEAAAGANPLLRAGGAFVTALTLMLFLGCTGKSAQIPLFVWLPDAMAGPTPVSALIHAATMVTAGVYLMVRLSALFALAPATMLVVAIVAALTAFVAGSIALTQRDIKKVLAYSTVSQLGYMFLACGVGAFVAGIFHVFTHAFFKGLLFLGAGSVIHSAHHEQDLFNLGGLRRAMPKTAVTFFIACLAIAGIPPLAGFFSKDEILWQTFASGRLGLWVLGVVTALMTAIYSFRAYFLTFEGESRLEKAHGHGHGDAHGHGAVHESPATMTIPLILLAVGAVGAGFLNLPPLFLGGEGKEGVVSTFLEPVLAPAREIIAARAHMAAAGEAVHHGAGLEVGLMLFSIALAVAGLLLARHYALKAWPAAADRAAHRFGSLYQLSYHRWWWDDFYNLAVAGGLRGVARLATWFDRWIIDGILHTIGGLASLGSRALRGLQNGQVQSYALGFLVGVNVVVWLVLWF